jgi:hypothetical protein
MYWYIMSFCNPEKSDCLSQEVKFNTRTSGPIPLEDNLSMFILQHFGSSDLNERGEGSVVCCTEYHKTHRCHHKQKMMHLWCHPKTEASDIHGTTGHSSGLNLVQARKRASHAVSWLAFQDKPIMEYLLTFLSKALTNQRVASPSSSPNGHSVRNSLLCVQLHWSPCVLFLSAVTLVVHGKDKWPSYFCEAANVE